MTNAVHDATLAFGSLMQGVTVPPMGGFSPIEQIETLLGMMGQYLQSVQAVGLPTMREILGMNAVGTYIDAQIALLEQDQREKQRAKMYADELGRMMNNVKKLQQNVQQAEAAKQQQGGNGNGMAETMQKLQQNQAIFEQKLQQKELANAQRTQHKQVAFVDREKQNEVAHAIGLRRKAQSAAINEAADIASRTNDLLAEEAKRKAVEKSGGE